MISKEIISHLIWNSEAIDVEIEFLLTKYKTAWNEAETFGYNQITIFINLSITPDQSSTFQLSHEKLLRKRKYFVKTYDSKKSQLFSLMCHNKTQWFLNAL